jgi:hypothetical protein
MGNHASDRQLTFLDDQARVIAVTFTSTNASGTGTPGSNRKCVWSSAYSVTVPREAFYQVWVAGESRPRPPVSYETLRASDFHYYISPP